MDRNTRSLDSLLLLLPRIQRTVVFGDSLHPRPPPPPPPPFLNQTSNRDPCYDMGVRCRAQALLSAEGANRIDRGSTVHPDRDDVLTFAQGPNKGQGPLPIHPPPPPPDKNRFDKELSVWMVQVSTSRRCSSSK